MPTPSQTACDFNLVSVAIIEFNCTLVYTGGLIPSSHVLRQQLMASEFMDAVVSAASKLNITGTLDYPRNLTTSGPSGNMKLQDFRSN